MPSCDIATADAYRLLSEPEPSSAFTLSRRRFLQGFGVLGAGYGLATMVPHWAREAFAAQPIGPHDGVLVLLMMGGGNDALNTVAPFTDSTYLASRGSAAITSAKALPLDGRFGFHPNLKYLKQLYDSGQVAVVQGVGYPNPDLSHFVSMANWMRAWGGTGSPYTGWLGRWLDGIGGGSDPLQAVQLGSTVPLHLIGANRRAVALGTSSPFGTSTEQNDQRVFAALRDMASATAGLGPYADMIAATQRDLLDAAAAVAPVYKTALPKGRLVDKLTLAARLINADLGIRVLSVGWGDFDSHHGLLAMHGDRMNELDAAVAAFFRELDARFNSRVALMTFSEFGRQLVANDNAGTDHGTAGVQLLIGSQVRGGMFGEPPSLTQLDRGGQLISTTHFGSVFTPVLQTWLGGDAAGVLGRSYPSLDLFTAVPGTEAPPPPPGPAEPGALIAVTPFRRLDTRLGTGAARAALGPGATVDVLVAGTGDVPPTGVTAAVLNVTVVSPTAAGYLTVWPKGEPRPLASNLNFMPGQVVPNMVVSKIGAGGKVSIFNPVGSTEVIADVVGYVHAGGGLAVTPVLPMRLLDTRLSGRSKLGPGGTIDLVVTGGSVPSANVSGVVLNVTATGATEASYVTVYPTGGEQPLASNLNFQAGDTVPNLVLAKVGTGGQVRLFNSSGSTDLVVDLLGYASPSAGTTGRIVAVPPARRLDTRIVGNGGALGPREARVVPMAGQAGLPSSGVAGVVVNVTVTDPAGSGYLTVWPADHALPWASNLNFVAGQTVPNLVLSATSPGGDIKVLSSHATHVILDVVGYVTA
jgi:uncharacterized protein (DUF1501 family)